MVNIDLLDFVSGPLSGLRIFGARANDLTGFSVSGAGDFNNDGFADVLIGAYGATYMSRGGSGMAYVIFGHNDDIAFADVDLANFIAGPASGLSIYGTASDLLGYSVCGAGDMNGDGIDDIIV
eukprot:gene39150-biopygen397